jgi:hypothetical protein
VAPQPPDPAEALRGNARQATNTANTKLNWIMRFADIVSSSWLEQNGRIPKFIIHRCWTDFYYLFS